MKTTYRVIVGVLATLSVGPSLLLMASSGQSFEASNAAAWRVVQLLPAQIAVWIALAVMLVLGSVGVFSDKPSHERQDSASDDE